MARVDVGSGKALSLAWVTEVATDEGTPRLHLRRTSVVTAASEVLLLSKNFYARVSSAGALLHTRVEDGLWLPADDAALAVKLACP